MYLFVYHVINIYGESFVEFCYLGYHQSGESLATMTVLELTSSSHYLSPYKSDCVSRSRHAMEMCHPVLDRPITLVENTNT